MRCPGVAVERIEAAVVPLGAIAEALDQVCSTQEREARPHSTGRALGWLERRPIAAAPLPGVVDRARRYGARVHAAVEDDGIQRRIVGHRSALAFRWGVSRMQELPGGAVPAPGVVQRSAGAETTEQDDLAVAFVVGDGGAPPWRGIRR